MKIPESAADEKLELSKEIVNEKKAYILNPYFGKEFLTRQEAINAINMLSGMLLIDVHIQRYKQSDKEHGENICKT